MYDDFNRKCNRIKALIRADYADAYHDWREGYMSTEQYIKDCFQLRLHHVTWINETFTQVWKDDSGEHVNFNDEAIANLTDYAVMVYKVFVKM